MRCILLVISEYSVNLSPYKVFIFRMSYKRPIDLVDEVQSLCGIMIYKIMVYDIMLCLCIVGQDCYVNM